MNRYLQVFILSSVVIILSNGDSYSQTKKQPRKAFDTAYVDVMPQKWSIRVYTASKSQHFYLYNEKWKNRIKFEPETKFAAGFGVSYRDLAVDLGLTLYRHGTMPELDTRGFNFIGSVYSNQNIVDVTFQINNGFTETSTNDEGVETQILRNDINVFNFGVNYNYLFNFYRYSFNSSFIGTQIQKKSEGSPMLGVFFSNFMVTADDSIIPADFHHLFPTDVISTRASVFSTGFTVGYTYTLLLPLRFYITASLNPGITLSLGDAQRDTLNIFENLQTLSPKLVSRNAIGYAGDIFYASFSYGIDINDTNLGNKNHILYTPEKIKMVLGYRIPYRKEPSK